MQRKLKAVTAFIFIIVYSTILTACQSSEPIEGEELILTARNAYVALDSARVEVVNIQTNVAEQTFVFKYDEKDSLTYYYTGTVDNKTYEQFNDGFVEFTNDCGELSRLSKGDKSFSAYIRGERLTYPYADKGLILFQKNAVESAEVVTEDGVTKVTHIYNPKKINQTSDAGEVTGFSAVYYFNEDGELLYLDEITEIGETSYCYRITISMKNEVPSVPNPFEVDEDGKIVKIGDFDTLFNEIG